MVSKKKIKIAYVIDALNIGGTENQLLKQIELLSAKGYEQYLFCLRSSQSLTNIYPPCSIINLNVKSLISINGIKKILRTAKLFKRNNIDIVQTYFIDANFFGVLAAKLAGIKNIISCRRDMGFWYSKSVLILLRILNIFVDRILVNSEAIKENVHRQEGFCTKKIDVIYNGIDLFQYSRLDKLKSLKLRETLGIPIEDSIVGIVANLNRKVKRVDLFVKISALVRKSDPKVSFVVVGDGYLRQELEDLALKYHIKEKLFFVGLQKNVLPYLNLFNIGVLTSESEGCSNSIVEYMAAGLPVICFDSGGNRELIKNGKNGFLVKFDDCYEFALKILFLKSRYEIMKLVEQNNLSFVTNFDWQKICDEIDEYYHSLV